MATSNFPRTCRSRLSQQADYLESLSLCVAARYAPIGTCCCHSECLLRSGTEVPLGEGAPRSRRDGEGAPRSRREDTTISICLSSLVPALSETEAEAEAEAETETEAGAETETEAVVSGAEK